MNQFLEEYLIYFKSELMLNSKLSHVANLLIRSQLAVTTKSSEWSEMVDCVKVFCFRPKEKTGCVKEKCGDDSFVYDDHHPFADIVITFSSVQSEWNLP